MLRQLGASPVKSGIFSSSGFRGRRPPGEGFSVPRGWGTDRGGSTTTRPVAAFTLAASAFMLVLSRAGAAAPDPGAKASAPARFILNMVHHNPGEPLFQTKWNDPAFLKSWGYNGQIPKCYVQCAITYQSFDPALLPAGSPARQWVDRQAKFIDDRIKEANAAGIPLYPFTDVLVVPKSLMEKYGPQMKTGKELDISRPMTQEVVRQQVAGIFDRFPDLAGLTIRFGETYLQDTPFHTGGRPMPAGGEGAIQGHTTLINLLRDEVCVKRHKVLIYRTWDFGNNFHTNPDFYLKVTDAVPPDPNLVFSIKHQKGDFHRLTPFNPTLTLGKHPQIVEVECQLEGYGKGAHPYYIGQGVIDGWEEYAWMMKPGEPKGLRDIVHDPRFAGVWTWSRGGGWQGPYITNELWCDLNAYVVSHFVEDPSRSEEAIFDEFARKIGLQGDDIARFRQLNLLSAAAVLRGQLSLVGNVDPWWCRDQYFAAPNLDDIIRKAKVEAALQEKADAVRMWKQIEDLASQIHFPDPATQEFVETSCTYGRIKYSIIQQAWTILLYGREGDLGGKYDREKIAAALAEYDRLWDEWRRLKAAHLSCATLYQDARTTPPGKSDLKTAIDRYRQIVQDGQQ